MKKLLFLILTITIITSCNNNSSQVVIYRTAQDINLRCPIDLDDYTILEGAEYVENSFFAYYLHVDETKCPVELFKSNITQIENNIKSLSYTSGILSPICEPESEEFIDACKRTNTQIQYNFSGKDSTWCIITLDPQEMETTIKWF